MTKRERDKLNRPLSKRSHGLRILLEWVNPMVFRYTDTDPLTISESDLRHNSCLHAPFKCVRCYDTGHVGCGPAPPLTGIECSCEGTQRRKAESAAIFALRERVRELERLLADRVIGEVKP